MMKNTPKKLSRERSPFRGISKKFPTTEHSVATKCAPTAGTYCSPYKEHPSKCIVVPIACPKFGRNNDTNVITLDATHRPNTNT